MYLRAVKGASFGEKPRRAKRMGSVVAFVQTRPRRPALKTPSVLALKIPTYVDHA